MPSSFDAAGGSSTHFVRFVRRDAPTERFAQNAARPSGVETVDAQFWIRRVKSSPYGSTIVSHVEAPRRASLLPSRAFLQSPRSIVDRPVVARSHPSRGDISRVPPRPTSVRRSSRRRFKRSRNC